MISQLRVQELPRMTAGGVVPVLLDVREPWELERARIAPEGTELLHIPMMQIPARLAEIPPQRPILCLCHHGSRSAQVAHFLMRQGFEQVWNVAGGIDAWSLEIDPAVPRY